MPIKKSIVTLCVYLYAAVAFSQIIPNYSFENWSSSKNPDGWSTLESATGLPSYFAFHDTFSVNGFYSLRLKSDTITLGGAKTCLSGIAALGNAVNINGALRFTGTGYPYRPDTLFFSYKYEAALGKNDTGYLAMSLKKRIGTADSIFMAVGILLDTTRNWISGYVPLASYYKGNLAKDSLDTLSIQIYAAYGTPKQGSQLWVDNIQMTVSATNVGITDISNLMTVDIYPNPAADMIQIALPERELGARLLLHDMNGKLVKEEGLPNPLNKINVAGISCGKYVAKVLSRDNITTFQTVLEIVR